MDDLPQGVPARPTPPPRRPALVITIYNWATPLFALLMLVVGLLGGYFVRPVLEKGPATPTPAPAPTASGAQQGQAVDLTEMMNELTASTQHFLGDANAPVTIIEFSDFQ